MVKKNRIFKNIVKKKKKLKINKVLLKKYYRI